MEWTSSLKKVLKSAKKVQFWESALCYQCENFWFQKTTITYVIALFSIFRTLCVCVKEKIGLDWSNIDDFLSLDFYIILKNTWPWKLCKLFLWKKSYVFVKKCKTAITFSQTFLVIFYFAFISSSIFLCLIFPSAANIIGFRWWLYYLYFINIIYVLPILPVMKH